MQTNTTTLVDATYENVESAIAKIKLFAEEKGYQIKGEFSPSAPEQKGLLSKLFSSKPEKVEHVMNFESKKKKKVLKHYLTRLEKHISMSQANKFLHFLYKTIYQLDAAPKINYSEKELKIKESKKAWKKIQIEADKLQAEYKKEKGDFYKKKTA